MAIVSKTMGIIQKWGTNMNRHLIQGLMGAG